MPNHYTLVAICGGNAEGFDGHDFAEHKVPRNLCDAVRPMPEAVKPEVEGLEPPWYSWAMKHWGTKWGTYGMKVSIGGDSGAVTLTMQCAWGPPHDACLLDITEWLKRTYGFTAIKWVGFDPSDCSIDVIDLQEVAS